MKKDNGFNPTLLFTPIMLSSEAGYPVSGKTDEDKHGTGEDDDFFDNENNEG